MSRDDAGVGCVGRNGRGYYLTFSEKGHAMTSDFEGQVLENVQKLNVWHRRGERAPHKPLLVLLTLSQIRHTPSGD